MRSLCSVSLDLLPPDSPGEFLGPFGRDFVFHDTANAFSPTHPPNDGFPIGSQINSVPSNCQYPNKAKTCNATSLGWGATSDSFHTPLPGPPSLNQDFASISLSLPIPLLSNIPLVDTQIPTVGTGTGKCFTYDPDISHDVTLKVTAELSANVPAYVVGCQPMMENVLSTHGSEATVCDIPFTFDETITCEINNIAHNSSNTVSVEFCYEWRRDLRPGLCAPSCTSPVVPFSVAATPLCVAEVTGSGIKSTGSVSVPDGSSILDCMPRCPNSILSSPNHPAIHIGSSDSTVDHMNISSASNVTIMSNDDCNSVHACTSVLLSSRIGHGDVNSHSCPAASVHQHCLPGQPELSGHDTIDPGNNCNDLVHHSCPGSSSGQSDLSSLDHNFLDMCISVDSMNVNTHLSSSPHISQGMCPMAFSRRIVPILNKMGNHKCDNVSFQSAAWNTHGLLGNNSTVFSPVHKMKYDGAKRLLTSNHIVGLIEVHADYLECDMFSRKWSHSHVCFWSITDDRNCGGVALCISKSFLSTCLLCFPIVIVPGRIIGVLLVFPNVNLLFICIHNSPTWNAFERQHCFKLVRGCIPDCLRATSVLCGDLNFSNDTIRFNSLLPDVTITNFHKALASIWEGLFHDFIEVAHDCPSFMRGTYLSQLDHVWINTLPAILLDLNPSAAVVWQLGDYFGKSSDHAPLRLSIGADNGNRVASVPRWVPIHPEFKAHCIRLSEEVRILPGSPYDVLQRHKAILKEAARLTVKFAPAYNIELCIDQRIYWSMILLRHRHDLSSIHVATATSSYKHLCSFISDFNGERILDIRQLALHIDELQYSKATHDIDGLPSNATDSEANRVKLNRLGSYLGLWASRRRKISNLVIVDDSGNVSHDASSAAHMLGSFWAPNFRKKKVSLALARVALKEHISSVDNTLVYLIPFDTFCERIDTLRDSGVGCDSLLYSCWRYCHEGARIALWQFYLHLLYDGIAPDENEFLDSRLVFIGKGRIDSDQANNCRRHPKKTRPLNLANTDCKIVSCMGSLVLSTVCSTCIATRQSGGMRGKQMVDLIFALEAKVIDYIVRNVPNSGIFALDIASAFPTLSREYLFWVLKKMGLPVNFIRLIRSLHSNSRGTICFKNLLFDVLGIFTGVKQGDPSAMQLFILGYDPLIRFISAALSPVEHILLPYCDDLAVIVENVFLAWQILLKCFEIISKVSSLHINTDKTQFLLTSSTKELDAANIVNFDNSVSLDQFRSAIKYLGILIGTDCLDENWEQVLCDYLATSRFISSLDCGLLTKISLYNMLAIAKLSYVASFLPPNSAALKAENKALQCLCRGPWNAIPPNLLKSVKQIGMPSQAVDLTVLSIASKIRVAHETSQTVFARSAEIDSVYNGIDIVLIYLDYKLCNSTCIKTICTTYNDFVANRSLNVTGVFSQKKVYNKLWGQRSPFCFKAFVSLKVHRILGTISSDSQLNRIIAAYLFSSSISFALTFTHIRTISNHWCTKSRFQCKNQACAFACGHQTDNIRHSCACASFWAAFFRVACIAPFSISLSKIIVFCEDSVPINDHELHTILIGLHTCFLCFNACRHGMAFSDRLVQHHLSHFMRQHHRASIMLRGLQVTV